MRRDASSFRVRSGEMDEERTTKRLREGDGQVEKRSLTGSAMQMVAQYAELGGAGVVLGAAHETGRRLVGQAFDRPSDPPPPKIEVEQGYRLKHDLSRGE
jgi:hypothetical protein